MIPPPIIKERLPKDDFGSELSVNWLPGVIRETANELELEEGHVINL